MNIGFDLISDLNLSPTDKFDWENKATSLYCLVAGNVSSDLKTLELTLNHLSKFYQGVFYTPGSLEFDTEDEFSKRVSDIARICKRIKNLAFLHHHVVIVDGVAILGCNGWYKNDLSITTAYEEIPGLHRFEDLFYLKNSIDKLQKHLDVVKIIVLTNAVPDQKLYFGEAPNDIGTLPDLTLTLLADSEYKISHWAFGTHEKIVDTKLDGINYINNPCNNRNPYWAKRITIDI